MDKLYIKLIKLNFGTKFYKKLQKNVKNYKIYYITNKIFILFKNLQRKVL